MSTTMTKPSLPSDASTIRRKAFDLAIKADDIGDNGEFTVYAAVFGNLDRQNDVIDQGAFANLNEFAADGVGLVNHDMMSLPVAWIETASQDGTGLKVSGRFHSTPEAQACRTVIKERLAAGKSVKCSIGFRVLDYTIEQRGQITVTHLTKINVYEFSFVGVPANPLAGVVSAKAVEALTEAATVSEQDSAAKGGIIDYLKECVGLKTKAGRAMSKANFDAIKKMADTLGGHGDMGLDHAKSIKEYAMGCKAMSKALHDFIAPHDPDKPEPDGDEDGAPSDDDGDEPKKPEKKSDDVSAAERLRLLRLRAASHD